MGDPQNVSLYHSLNKTFVNNRTSDGGITIEDQTGLGWNMTQFQLNFTDLYTTEKYVNFQTRLDDADAFPSTSQTFYYNSFEIPNTCYLRNISIFVQVYGGDGSHKFKFNLTVYNAKYEGGRIIPDKNLGDLNDETFFNFDDIDKALPASWYQSNFTDEILNISKTYNNTFFTAFEVLEFSEPKKEGYFYYAIQDAKDKYASILYKNSSLAGSTLTELENKMGLFKINFSPLNNEITDPNQINLTVFNNPVNNDGTYINENFLEHEDYNFNIPISSPWFADVMYNISFSGNFRFNTQSSNLFNATQGIDVLWNSSLTIIHYPDEGYDNKARFYKPSYWIYNNTFNGTDIFNDENVNNDSDYIEILNASNHRWSIFYNQPNAISASQIEGSSNKNLWYELTESVNITDYINASFSSENSNGNAWLKIKSVGYSKTFQKTINTTQKFFDNWRIDQNTTITENNTQIQLNIMTHNGTMAGIKIHTIKTILSHLNITLLSKSEEPVLKNEPYSFNFSVQNMYNSENVSIETLSIKYERNPDEWVNLVRDYHYNLYSNGKNGKYNITLNTELSEFLAGTYNINFTFGDGTTYFFNELSIENFTLKERTLNISVTGHTYSNKTYLLGSQPNYTLYLNDSITDLGISGLKFEIFGDLDEGSNTEFKTSYYSISDLGDGYYNITINTENLFSDYSLQNLTLTFQAHKEGVYNSINTTDEFDYSKANLDVRYNKITAMYVNDTVSKLALDVNSNVSLIETAEFNVSLGPNSLIVASLGKGKFQVYMDSTDLNINKTYEFSIKIQKKGYNTYSDRFNITITPYDANVQIPENFQNLRVYQQQTIRVISILSNTFTEREILNADVRMTINGTNIYSDNFTQLANKNGWYEGTLNVGDVSPGNHSLIIEMKAENYTPKNASTSIIILERAGTSLNITEELKNVYIWGDFLAIPVRLTSNNNPMSNTTITFRITETFTGGELSTDTIILSTNEEGIARFEHVIPEGVQNLEILIYFSGTNSLRPVEVSITDLSFRSPAEQTFLNILPFIPLMIGGIVGVSGFVVYRVIQRRKKVEKWKEKAQIYKDAQNVRFMLVLDKMSGQPVIQQDFGETGYDGSLIGGLLQAMTNFLHGLQKKEPGAGDKTSMLFDYKENEILIQDGEFSRGVLMLNEVPSEETKKILTEFVQNFEEQYGKHLQPFKGNLRVFDGYQELIDNYCKTHLLRNFHVSRDPPEGELDSFHEKVLSISKTFELISRKNFDLNSLIDYVKSKVEDVLEERIIAVIIDLVDEGFLEPFPKEKGGNLK